MAHYYLEVTAGAEAGRRYALALGAAGIGRGRESAVAFDRRETAVSAQHAVLYVSDSGVVLQDLQSTNGTYVNGERLTDTRELRPGDEIGLGRTGPRLRFVSSGTPLATGAAAALPPPETSGPLPDKGPDMVRSTAQERAPAAGGGPDTAGPATVEYEARLKEQRLSATGMHRLIRDSGRVRKLLERDGLDSSQKSMLSSMHGAHRRARGRWLAALAAVALAAAVAVTWFALRARHYRRQLEQARALEAQLDRYDQAIAAARGTGVRDNAELERLMREYDQRNREFSSVRAELDDSDMRKVYADPLEQAIDRILAGFGETAYHVPAEMVQRVRHHVDAYSGRLKPTIARYLSRKPRYFPMISAVLREKNLPEQLAYLAMLESGLNPSALSHAGARGLWQLMPSTARSYRLRVDSTVDERTDPAKSTRAAAEYVRDLIGIFGGQSSAMLAMAAYNAGEGRLMGALKRIEDPMRNRDFWYIYRMGYLAEETNEYIPRVLALMVIDADRQRYGFSEEPSADAAPESEHDFDEFKQQPTDAPLSPSP